MRFDADEGLSQAPQHRVVARPVKDFGHQRPATLHVTLGKFDRQFHQFLHARCVGRRNTGQVGSHVRDHQINLTPGQSRL